MANTFSVNIGKIDELPPTMQLNKFTDYALRILMYVSQPREMLYTIAELAERLEVSENHAVKIVHFMAKQHWIITTRGKGGGIRLAPSTLELSLGYIVRCLEQDQPLVNCHTPPCVLVANCQLKSILNQALAQFYDNLDQFKFKDVIRFDPTKKTMTIPLLEL